MRAGWKDHTSRARKCTRMHDAKESSQLDSRKCIRMSQNVRPENSSQRRAVVARIPETKPPIGLYVGRDRSWRKMKATMETLTMEIRTVSTLLRMAVILIVGAGTTARGQEI